MAQFDYSDFFLFWFWKIKMDNENGVQENVEEPIAIDVDGEVEIKNWKMWLHFCKDSSLKSKVINLRLNVTDGQSDTPMEADELDNPEIQGTKEKKNGSDKRISIKGYDNLVSVRVGNNCFNGVWKNISKNAVFSVTECGKLKTITVGEYSFQKLDRFEVFNNPRLETITWGKGSFKKCNIYSFSGTLVFFH